MRKIICLLTAGGLGLVLSCQSSDEAPEPERCTLGPPELISCITVYEPVCGCDGNTYSNECMATAAGVPNYTTGECGN